MRDAREQRDWEVEVRTLGGEGREVAGQWGCGGQCLDVTGDATGHRGTVISRRKTGLDLD